MSHPKHGSYLWQELNIRFMGVASKTDVLVVGSGIAGLTTAIKIAETRADLKVTILAKGSKDERQYPLCPGRCRRCLES
jgi:choline dehydrogenase-like flavoprotein